MRVVMGADYWATRKLIREAARIEGPVYLRFTKGPIKPVYDEDVELTIGKANLLRDGKNIAIIANGDTVNIAVSEVCAGMGKGIVKRIGVQDWFGQSGPYDKLLEINGTTFVFLEKTSRNLLTFQQVGVILPDVDKSTFVSCNFRDCQYGPDRRLCSIKGGTHRCQSELLPIPQ